MENLFQTVMNLLFSLALESGGGLEVGPVERLDTGGTQPAFVQLVANRNGEMLAVWQVYTGAVDNALWFNRYRPGAGWGEARRGSDRAIIHDVQPALADNGTAGLLWNQSISVWSNILIEDAAGVQEQRDPDAGSPRLKPGPAAGDPLLCALWEEVGNNTLQSADYHWDGGWTAPVTIPLLTAEEQDRDRPPPQSPQGITLAVSSPGERLAVWSSLVDIRASRWTPGLGWSAAQIVAVPVAAVFSDPYLALGDGGAAVVIWTELAGGQERLLAVRSEGAGWSAPQVLAEQAGVIFGGVHLAVDPAGDVVAVWHQATTTDHTVYATRYRDGRWEAPQVLGAGTAPDLAMTAGGDMAVVWLEDGRVRARGLAQGALGWTEAVTLSSPGSALAPQAGLEPDGTLVVVWATEEGALWGVTAEHRD